MAHQNCVLCEMRIVGQGNNPWPLKAFGKCCNQCNASKVVYARIQQHTGTKATIMAHQNCVLCEMRIVGQGNNPWPLKAFGKCCNQCNASKVVYARIQQHTGTKTDEPRRHDCVLCDKPDDLGENPSSAYLTEKSPGETPRVLIRRLMERMYQAR